jgi:nucleoside 2-deoxyribosyltransferase
MIERIWSQIESADFIISDLTFTNPNVYYETGYALANGKLSILITKNPMKIPFDLKNSRHLIYSSLDDLQLQLQTELVAAQGETDLSFDPNDPQCVATVGDNIIEHELWTRQGRFPFGRDSEWIAKCPCGM